jgi:phosphoribosylformylglycinamidine cyclo-ligase
MRRGDPEGIVGSMPPIFQLLAAKGGVAEAELYQVFNMGIGMTIIVAADKADAVLQFVRARGQTAWIIGEITRGTGLAKVV